MQLITLLIAIGAYFFPRKVCCESKDDKESPPGGSSPMVGTSPTPMGLPEGGPTHIEIQANSFYVESGSNSASYDSISSFISNADPSELERLLSHFSVSWSGDARTVWESIMNGGYSFDNSTYAMVGYLNGV